MVILKIGMIERHGLSDRLSNSRKAQKKPVEINQKPATSKLEINRKGGTLTRCILVLVCPTARKEICYDKVL